jgi:small ligand-binding sensory domain FIST
MIHAGVGLSTDTDTELAAERAAAQAAAGLPEGHADFAVAFVTAEHAAEIPELVQSISATLGTPYVVGCSAAGVIASGREVEDGPAVGVLAVRSDSLRGTPFLFGDTGDHGLTAGLHLGQRLMASRDTRDVILVWPDPYVVRPDRLLQGIDATLGAVPVAGGAASSPAPSGGTFQFSGGEVATGAVSGLRLGGDFRHHVAITQGCRPLGGPRRITSAHDNMVLEVDGVPALEALRSVAPEGFLDDPAEPIQSMTIALLPEPGESILRANEYLVRNIVAIDPDTGVIAVAADVEEGQSILFAHREPGAAREDVARMAARAATAAPASGYRFGLYHNCLARGRSLYGREGVDSAAFARYLPGVPLLGFFCNAEIAPLRGSNHLFTYTGVLVLFSD